MKKKCKLPRGTVIKCNIKYKGDICKYLLSCSDVTNPSRYNGSGDNDLGLNHLGYIAYSNEFSVDNTISYEQFQKLIAEPTEPVVNEVVTNYQIF